MNRQKEKRHQLFYATISDSAIVQATGQQASILQEILTGFSRKQLCNPVKVRCSALDHRKLRLAEAQACQSSSLQKTEVDLSRIDVHSHDFAFFDCSERKCCTTARRDCKNVLLRFRFYRAKQRDFHFRIFAHLTKKYRGSAFATCSSNRSGPSRFTQFPIAPKFQFFLRGIVTHYLSLCLF